MSTIYKDYDDITDLRDNDIKVVKALLYYQKRHRILETYIQGDESKSIFNGWFNDDEIFKYAGLSSRTHVSKYKKPLITAHILEPNVFKYITKKRAKKKEKAVFRLKSHPSTFWNLFHLFKLRGTKEEEFFLNSDYFRENYSNSAPFEKIWRDIHKYNKNVKKSYSDGNNSMHSLFYNRELIHDYVLTDRKKFLKAIRETTDISILKTYNEPQVLLFMSSIMMKMYKNRIEEGNDKMFNELKEELEHLYGVLSGLINIRYTKKLKRAGVDFTPLHEKLNKKLKGGIDRSNIKSNKNQTRK